MSAIRFLVLSSFLVAPLFGDESSKHVEGLRQNKPQVWALLNARVVVSPERTLDRATIVVRKGRIDTVSEDGAVPPDARVIDLSGKTVYPGFIDAYAETKLSTDGLSRTARYWNPNVTPELSVAQQLSRSASANADIRKQGIVAQLVAPSSGIIRGHGVVVSTGTTDPNESILARDVTQHLQLTAERRSREVYPGSPMGAVALARQAMYDAQWYRDAWNAAAADSTLPRPEFNESLKALQRTIDGTQPVVVETSDELFFLRAERFCGEFGLKLIVRGSGKEYRRLDEIAATQRPVIVPLNFPKPPNVTTAEVAGNVTLESLLHWDFAPENPARMEAAGIRFAFTTDKLSSVSDFLKALRKSVSRGLSAQSALRALTQTPAELLGISDQLGSIQKGKLASFLVTDGDIFDEKTKVQETWVDGIRFQHTPDPVSTVAGVYEVHLQKSHHPRQLHLKLTQDGGKISGEISRSPFPSESDEPDDKSPAQDEKADDEKADEKTNDDESGSGIVKLQKPSLNDYTVSASFSTKEWGNKGTVRLTLVFTKGPSPDQAAPSAFGQFLWPDGARTTALLKASQNEDSSADTKSSDSSEKNDTKDGDKEDSAASFAVNYPLGAFGRERLPESVGLTAFVHATIWTSGPDGMIQDGTLLIRDGRIEAVGSELKIPADATVVDVTGMHISPGIIDCHSHMATDGGVNEATQAITCEVRIGDFIDCDDISIYRQLAGGVTSSNILHGSANPIGGQNQVIKLRWGMTAEKLKFAGAPEGVKFALGENVKQSNWGDEYTSRYPQTRMGVEQLFRDAFQAAREYGVRRDAWERSHRGLPPRRDLELDALREIVEQKRWIHCHSYRQDEILALIRVLDDHNITIGTFQHILEGYKVADAMAQHGAMGSAFSDWWAYKFEVLDAIPYAGALMHEAGVVVSFNSDDAELATHLNQEAAKAVKYGGLSPEEALKFVTLNPAKQLRIDDHVGSLETGKHADFVIWNGPPLSNFSRCEQTWIDGRQYFDRAEDAAMRQDVQRMRNALIQKIFASGEKMSGVGDDDDDPSKMWPRHDEFCVHGHDHGDHTHGQHGQDHHDHSEQDSLLRQHRTDQ